MILTGDEREREEESDQQRQQCNLPSCFTILPVCTNAAAKVTIQKENIAKKSDHAIS